MRGEDERSLGAEEGDVELGRREPLQVHEVGVPAEQPAHAAGMLERPEDDTSGPSGEATRARVERLVEHVAGGSGTFAKAKRRRHELDLDAGPDERSRELVVVGRGVGRGIGEDDAHGSYSRGALGPARPQLERLPRAHRSARAPRLPPRDARPRDRRPARCALPPGGACLGPPPARGLERRDVRDAGNHPTARLAGAAHSLADALTRGVLPLGTRGAGERDPRASRTRPRGSRDRSDQRRRPRGEARLRGTGAYAIVLANLHASNDFAHPEIPRAEIRRAREFAEEHVRPGEAVVLAGDFNVRDPGLDGYSAPGEGIDHILVRGTRATRLETWPHARRLQNGAVLSDHAPVELRVASEDAS